MALLVAVYPATPLLALELTRASAEYCTWENYQIEQTMFVYNCRFLFLLN
jgi:hypothetical protein